MRSTEGQPYSAANIAADRDTVLGYYYNDGYPDAQFESSQDPAPAPNRVNLRYRVTPGERQYVRGTLVRGLETTKPSLVASRISLAPGDPISQSRIAQSQQKLYDLGIFSKVQTALQNPEGKEERKYVLFHLDEARKYSFNFGVGAELARIGGRHQLARLPGRSHRLQPARVGRRQPDQLSGAGPHGELANPGFHAAPAGAGQLRRAAIRGA